ncbi:MAG: RNB domain-containing ribonuclease [Treponema sp.]|jgi:exoribonuclease-2|nr:RNB domain-containing ribonuclease [Treponema sp.]
MVAEKNLVAYKGRPALVTAAGEKIDIIVLGSGEKARVREKDIEVLYAGPVTDAAELEQDLAALTQEGGIPAAAVREAWELLAGSLEDGASVPLGEFAELVFGAYSPQSVWGAYLLLNEGLYVTGTIAALRPRTQAEVEAGEQKREARAREGQDREAVLDWLKKRRRGASGRDAGEAGYPPGLDEALVRRHVQDAEALACGKSAKSRTLKELGLPETPEDAHGLLLDTGLWTPYVNPHPARFGLSPVSAKIIPAPPPEEARRDLTGLLAFAIDNPWSADPDDAVSVEGDALYVHVADPSASIGPENPAEREARDRGATLYLPEGASRMLAEEALALFALGLAEKSPALSFKITLDETGEIRETEIFPSRVQVTRLSYAQADSLLDAGPGGPAGAFPEGAAAALEALCRIAERNRQRRETGGAVFIELPETHISVAEERVSIEPVAAFRSAALVRECMLLAGEGAALWAGRQNPGGRQLAFPYISQEAGDLPSQILPGIAGSCQLRRCMRARTLSVRPGRHWGLGLEIYTQVTSPLRRYTDLLAHIQIRALLRGEEPLPEEEVLARLAAGDAAASATVQAERASRAHWTAVYLADKKDSLWDAVVLEKKGFRGAGQTWALMIPALALETQVPLPGDPGPNDAVQMALKSVNIPKGEIGFTFSPAESR